MSTHDEDPDTGPSRFDVQNYIIPMEKLEARIKELEQELAEKNRKSCETTTLVEAVRYILHVVNHVVEGKPVTSLDRGLLVQAAMELKRTVTNFEGTKAYCYQLRGKR